MLDLVPWLTVNLFTAIIIELTMEQKNATVYMVDDLAQGIYTILESDTCNMQSRPLGVKPGPTGDDERA